MFSTPFFRNTLLCAVRITEIINNKIKKMEKKIVYNLSKATKITFGEKNNIFEIKVFFESQSIVFNYESEEKANEAFSALSNFKGTVTQIGNELNINIF